MLRFYEKGECGWDILVSAFPAEVGKYKLHRAKYKV